MKVYHLNDSVKRTWIFCDVSTAINFDKNFDKVADVDLPDNLEDAFRLTNSIETFWWYNDGVVKGDKEGYRSTSVGDVVELSDGTFHMVDGTGWMKIDVNNRRDLMVTHFLKEVAWDVNFINSKHFVG